MTKVSDKAVHHRIIGHIKGKVEGPTLIFVGGMHGNEPAGVTALTKVLKALDPQKDNFKGNVYAIAGNLPALQQEVRYQNKDLNRLWTQKNLDCIENGEDVPKNPEFKELRDIHLTLKNILENEKGPFYFFDLHTTSSQTVPFITVNDSLLNRRYTSQYPVPIILGIEEFLEGALLSYINELGYIAFGFEGGQHEDPAAIENHVSFIYLSLVFCGSIPKDVIAFDKHFKRLSKNTKGLQTFYEILNKYEIQPLENFKMEPGFKNFQTIDKRQHLATSNGKPIFADRDSQIFMPLYQGKGNDGFFIIQKIPKIFLHISKVLRNIHFDRILPWLPGVRWASESKDELVVDMKVARFLTKKFLRLMGYRSRQMGKTQLRVKSREAASREDEYGDMF
jgi:hypothetical protein